MKKRVVLDTNFLLLPAKQRIDIFEEMRRIIEGTYELTVASGTQAELARIAERQDADGKAAAVALQLLKEKKVRTLKSRKLFKEVDDFLIALAQEQGVIVATMDRELQKKLRCPYIICRSKNHLEMRQNSVLRD